MSRLIRVEYEDRIEALKRTVIPQFNNVGNTLLKFIKGQRIPKREEKILIEMNLLEYIDQQVIKKEEINWNLVGFPQAVTISRLGIEYLEHITKSREMNIDKKEQKELITEIMNEDAKDGLYKQQTAVTKFRNELAKILPSDLDMDIVMKIKQAYIECDKLHRTQVEEAYKAGDIFPAFYDSAEHYYTQTYL